MVHLLEGHPEIPGLAEEPALLRVAFWHLGCGWLVMLGVRASSKSRAEGRISMVVRQLSLFVV